MAQFYKEQIEFSSKEDVIKLHLLIKCFKKGIHLTNAQFDTLVELYYTGYNPTFYKNCVAKEIYKTEQVVRNAITDMTDLGVLIVKKRGKRIIDPEIAPTLTADKLIVQYVVGNP